MAPSVGSTPALEGILYKVEDRPPWYLCIFLGFQQFLTCFGAMVAFPVIVADSLCIGEDGDGKGQFISTVIFVSGVSTLIQSTIGVRLPIIQSVSYAFLVPVFVVMSLDSSNCPYQYPEIYNATTLPEQGSEEHRDIWHDNFAELSGSLMIASILQMVIGFTGLIGLMLRFIGPLTIAPTIMLISITLFKAAADKGSTHWYICFTTMVLMTLFSQYLRNVGIPFPCMPQSLKIFALFPVLMSVVYAWLICLILTETDVFTDDPKGWGYKARTDFQLDTISRADWFRFPYPGQFGAPRITVGAVLGLMAATLASIVESVGDYYACARLAGAPPPPSSAVSRGIGIEGFTCLFAGAWGLVAGNTSYSENIGAIGITKVGSRVVIQVAGALMVVLGCLGKFGALFATIPEPIVGGLFYIMFGMVAAVGASNLQFVDLNSTRNLFIFGLSLFFGLSVPYWVTTKGNEFNTGITDLDQILQVLSGTGMFVGGLMAFVLDNTIPGTREERGLIGWNKLESSEEVQSSTYDLPYIQPFLNRIACLRYVPFCPGFVLDKKRSFNDEELATPVFVQGHGPLDTLNGQSNIAYTPDTPVYENGSYSDKGEINTRV